jgi:hypothetical protein
LSWKWTLCSGPIRHSVQFHVYYSMDSSGSSSFLLLFFNLVQSKYTNESISNFSIALRCSNIMISCILGSKYYYLPVGTRLYQNLTSKLPLTL